jgi:hypothetical protein
VSRPQTASPILWTIGDWRCELQGSDRLLLYRGDEQIAEHVTRSPERVPEYADVWRAAIGDVYAPPDQSTLPVDGADAAQLWTDGAGCIQQVTDAAARLLNLSVKATRRRHIQIFFLTDRHRLAKMLDEAMRGHSGRLENAMLRPRERRQIHVSATLDFDPELGLVRWTISQ